MKKAIALFSIAAFLSAINIAQAQPVISLQPRSRTNNTGDNAQFTVITSGNATLTYQWQHNGGNIGGATIVTATNALSTNTLNVLVTDASIAGLYRVLVSDTSGTNTSSDAVLSIAYANRTKITQWNFNSVSPDTNDDTGSTVPSIGSGTVTQSGVSQNQFNDGSPADPAYAGGDNSSRRWNVLANTPAPGVPNKTGGARFVVSTLGYENIAVSGSQWNTARGSAYWRGQYTTDGTNWVDRGLINLRNSVGVPWVYFSDDLSGVAGVANNTNFQYRIVGERELSATGAGADLYVAADPAQTYNNSGLLGWDMVTVFGTVPLEQPVITVQPPNHTGYVGWNSGFSVTATGGELTYQWLFNGGVINFGTSSTLVLTNVQPGNAGTYSVIVSNSAGFVTSDGAVLTIENVLPPPGDRYWSKNGSTAGGSGNWDTTSPNSWGLDAAGPFNLTWDNGNVDSAIFVGNGATPGAVVNASSVTVNKIIITNGPTTSYSLSGAGTINFSGANPGVFVDGSNSASSTNLVQVTCQLTGSVVTKSGGGRLNMNNTNTTVGRWIVNGGAITANTGNSADVLFGTGIPSLLVTDFITLDGPGGLGFAASGALTLGANRGIYLGAGGGQLGNNNTAGIITVDGPISGPGDLHFPGVTEWPGQVQGDNAIFIISNTNNNYGGWTRIATCEIRLGNNQVFPATTTLNITNGSINGRLNLNGFHQTVAKVILESNNTGQSRITDSVGGGTLSAAEFDLRRSSHGTNVSAVLAGSGFLRKTTLGNITLSAANTYTGDTLLQGGTLTLSGVGRFGSGAGTLQLEGGAISFNNSKTGADTLLNPVVLKADTTFQNGSGAATGDILCVLGGAWTSEGGKLFLWNTNTFAFEVALTNSVTLGHPIEFFGNPSRLTSFNPAGSEQVFNGAIIGPGSFKRSVESGAGGRTVFTAENSYDGGTLVEAGTLLVNNLSGSGTGSGSVTVNAPGGVLGGTGFIAGNVVVNDGGSIAPGASAGILTLQSGLAMSSGGTMVWELAALKDNANGVAGTDFDQIVLTSGELVLGGNSKLTLQFAVGTAPNSTIPFWQGSHSWTIVGLNGGLNTANAAFASIVNGSYGAGNFSTAVSGGNIVLTFTPGAQVEPSITAHPQSRTSIVGTTASFTVAATGSDPLSYSWYRTDAPFTAISGATSATFTIVNVQAANAGSYFARVSNGLGTATSGTATLTIVARPAIQPLSGAGTTNVVVTWPTLVNTQYQLQYNTNLATTNWFALTNLSGTGSNFSFTNHPPLGDPQRYFRLLVQ